MSIRFDDRVAIVTGAGGGLGRCHALALAERGAKVVINDLGGTVDGTGGSSDAAEAVVAEIKAAGGEAIANGASVTDDAGVANLVKQTMETYGRIDILINNAGILRDKSFAKLEMNDFELVVNVHLIGSAKVTKAVWPIMKEQQYGRILMTTSSSGLYGNFGQANYAAAKMGLVGFMGTLKIEGQKDNIRVNTLAPVAATRMTEELFPPEALEAFKPELVSVGAILLVRDDAPTGTILCAGAGHFARAQVTESPGVFIGAEATPEQVLSAWDQVEDRTEDVAYDMGHGQTLKFLEGAGIKWEG